MSVLDIQNLNFKYAKHGNSVFNNFNACFYKNRITAVVGSSGIGKTTLLMLISAMENKYKGSILFNGTDIRKMNRNNYRARNVGVIFQNYNLLFQASSIDNVLIGLNLALNRKPDREEARKLLLDVGITEEKHKRKCRYLSGGEQQRVAIARAMAGNPDIIIADEPTGNLDEENQDNIINIFKKLAQEKDKCIIIATHSKRVAEAADSIIELSSR